MERFKGTDSLLCRARWSRHETVMGVLRLIEGHFRLVDGVLSRENRTQGVVRAREVACYILLEHIGLTLTDASRLLRKSPSSVSRAVLRMRERIEDGDIEYKSILNELCIKSQ